MDYDYIISNLKENINKLKSYENIDNSSALINKFILDLAYSHHYEVSEINGAYYIKKGVAPKVILHLNVDSKFDYNGIDLIEENESKIISGQNINLFDSILLIASLLENSTNDFDVLITRNNIQSGNIDYSNLKSIIRSDNVINLNLLQAKCLADEFSSLILSNIRVPIERFNPDFDYNVFRLSLDNLIGGHTGEDLDKLRLNSIKTIMSIIRKFKSKIDMDICKIKGGDRYDFIPSNAYVDFIVKDEYENELYDTFNLYKNEYIEKNLKYEPDMNISLDKLENYDDNLPITDTSYNHIASLVELIPTGAFSVNSNNKQLISSLNLSTVRSFPDFVNFIIVYRSLTDENMDQMLERTQVAADISKSVISNVLKIPHWKNKDSYLTNKFSESYNNITGDSLNTIKTQYSLDSSIIFSNLDVNIVSLGVEYKKKDDNIYFTNLNDIYNVIKVIDDLLSHLYE
ncbi:hypothetical protein [uncultured Anaerococcus sp.]|uniref:hypothetical protein n=1 Tax=uncultured Anaerococcus sp. TaxID=293428 RepID=UPI0026378880|nr:hypothetical protein [uncultured Anaerococcus sp.]